MTCLACGGKLLEPRGARVPLQPGETWCRCRIGPRPIMRPIEGIIRPPTGPPSVATNSDLGISMRFIQQYDPRRYDDYDLQADNLNLLFEQYRNDLMQRQRYRDLQRLYEQQFRKVDDLMQRHGFGQALPPGFGEADETSEQRSLGQWTDVEREAYRERQVEAGRRSGRYTWNLTRNDKVFLRQRGIAIEEEE